VLLKHDREVVLCTIQHLSSEKLESFPGVEISNQWTWPVHSRYCRDTHLGSSHRHTPGESNLFFVTVTPILRPSNLNCDKW